MVVSGEVVGQRPMSQKKRDLALIAHRAGLDDRLLRPLSALLLPATGPSALGWSIASSSTASRAAAARP